MRTEEISVISEKISVRSVRQFAGDEKEVETSKNDSKSPLGKIFEAIGISVFGIIGFNLLFIIPWTSFPRTDSIIYQSNWMESLLPFATVLMIGSGTVFLDLITWTKEEAIMSMSNYLKIFSAVLIPYTIFYVSSYLLWSVYLQYNHPLPNLGMIYIPAMILQAIGLWFILPSHLLAKKDFRKKLKWYNLFFICAVTSAFLREILAILFFIPPGGYQFLVPFIIAGCRELDKRLRSKVVTKITGMQDEAASVLLAVAINCEWSFFIAVRLVGAEITTICCATAIDFALHLKVTIQIINNCRKTIDPGIEIGSTGNYAKLSTLIIAELIEGFTPLIYGICILMAFYGPNSNLLANIGKSHWGEAIEDLNPIYVTMSILFGVDTLSVLINCLCFWKVVNVNILAEIYRVLSKYWYFMAIYLPPQVTSMIAALDINFGLDPSGSFPWISNEGWIILINNSTALTKGEKAEIIANFALD